MPSVFVLSDAKAPRKRRRRRHLGQPDLHRCLERCDPVAYAEAVWKHSRGEKVSRRVAERLRRCLARCRA